ncbi:MAG: NADP-reducing hydrogenase subunit HndB [Rikenellaceae bacterium]|nr:NADP-reducing hydrogenase subunit HndB [Rikenellaceae bacterium]MDN5355740.1 NADP-reducing hydrogenase subunit HndB [Rikenellaceae bacterium]
MAKITSLDDLRKIKKNMEEQIGLREKAENPESLVQIKVGMATSGIAAGAKEIFTFLVDELEKRNIPAIVTQTGDMGYSYAEPTVEVKLPGQDPIVFGWVTKEKADEIIEKYIRNGELIEGIIPQNYKTIDEK